MGSLICFSLCMCAGEFCLFVKYSYCTSKEQNITLKVGGIAGTRPTGVGAAKKKKKRQSMICRSLQGLVHLLSLPEWN
jgi:hypothetical protein